MTLITFVNVVLRYVFNTGLIWGLEAVTYPVRLAGAVSASAMRSRSPRIWAWMR